MCGYFANIESTPEILKVSNQLDLELPLGLERAYQRRAFNALVTQKRSVADTQTKPEYQVGAAMWWFALKFDQQQFFLKQVPVAFLALVQLIAQYNINF